MNLTKTPLFVVFFILITSCKNQPYQTRTATSEGYTYEYVTDDPTQTRIYTLENGLKVYLSRFENAPRIHVFTAVKAGGKNDPKNNTGLAHYLEHMMFKGNQYSERKITKQRSPYWTLLNSCLITMLNSKIQNNVKPFIKISTTYQMKLPYSQFQTNTTR